MNAEANRWLPLHPGINFSCLGVGGDLGGCIFALGSVLVLVAGLPPIRWFVGCALVTAFPMAGFLLAWHQHHHGPPSLWSQIDLGLIGHYNPQSGGLARRPQASDRAAR